MKQDKPSRDGAGRFKSGVSGNPAGKPAGAAMTTKIRKMFDTAAGRRGIEDGWDKFLDKAVAMAINDPAGEMGRFFLSRALPMPKAKSDPTCIVSKASKNPVRNTERIITAAIKGEVPIDEARALVGAILDQRRVADSVKLEERIKKLEDDNAKGKS